MLEVIEKGIEKIAAAPPCVRRRDGTDAGRRVVVSTVVLGMALLGTAIPRIGALALSAQETPPTTIEPGSSWVDPEHGHRIFRLTGSGATHAYSYWTALNADNSMLFGYTGEPTLWDVEFRDTTVAVTNQRPAFSGGVQLYWEGFFWSRSNPDEGWGTLSTTSNSRLYRYDMATQTPTLIKDFDADSRFSSMFGSGVYLWQLQTGHLQERFAASVRNSSGTVVGVVVWDRTTDDLWTYETPAGEAIDEAHVSNHERYVYIILEGRQSQILDLSDGSLSPILDRSAGHPDMLDTEAIHAGDNGALGYSLVSPYDTRTIFDWPDRTVPGNEHTSTIRHGWIYSSVYGTDGTRDVIYRVRPDGTEWEILARHFSHTGSYSHIPFGAVTYDGQYVVFNSDWGGGQVDIYAVRAGEGEDIPAQVTGVEVKVQN